MLWAEFKCFAVIFDSLTVVALILIGKAPGKLRIGTLMNALVFYKPVQIVVDSFGGDAVRLPEVIQDRMFERFWNIDFNVWFNKTLLRLNEYAFLSNDAIARIPGLPGPFVRVV